MTARRVLLLDTGKEWGGGTNSMIELLKRIDRSRFDVTALFYRDYDKGGSSTLSAELAAIGVPLKILSPASPPWWEKPAKEIARLLCLGNRQRARRAIFAIERRTRIEPMARRIAAEIRAGGFKLLYMNNQPASNVEGFLAAAQAGVPAIQHCRTEPHLIAPIVELANTSAAAIICVSNGVADNLRAIGIVKPTCVVVHNGIDGHQLVADVSEVRSIRAQWECPDEAIVIGTVGRLVPLKRVSDLLHSAASVVGDNPGLPLRIVIVGEGSEAPQLRALAEHLRISERVRFVGFDPQPIRLMAAMDIVALCSSTEGLPRTLLEAMLAGRPVVASDIAGSREVVVDGTTGLLYPCGDTVALGRALRRLAEDAPLRHRMGSAGNTRVREQFSIDRYVEGVTSVLAAEWNMPR